MIWRWALYNLRIINIFTATISPPWDDNHDDLKQRKVCGELMVWSSLLRPGAFTAESLLHTYSSHFELSLLNTLYLITLWTFFAIHFILHLSTIFAPQFTLHSWFFCSTVRSSQLCRCSLQFTLSTVTVFAPQFTVLQFCSAFHILLLSLCSFSVCTRLCNVEWKYSQLYIQCVQSQ